MRQNEPMAHPWMANSLADIKQAMLKEIGAPSIEALFEQIPTSHRLKRPLNLPPQLSSEAELKRHLVELLARTENCEENLNFLGAGCWQHHVPAVVDEIVGRTEFVEDAGSCPVAEDPLFTQLRLQVPFCPTMETGTDAQIRDAVRRLVEAAI